MNEWPGVDADSREIATRASQTFGYSWAAGVGSYRYDRKLRRQFFEDKGAGANDEDDIRVALHDFHGQGFGAGCALLPAVAFYLEILSFDLSEPTEFGEQQPSKS